MGITTAIPNMQSHSEALLGVYRKIDTKTLTKTSKQKKTNLKQQC